MNGNGNILFAPPLSKLPIPPSVLGLLSPEKASELCVLPLARYREVVIFAVRDVQDREALLNLQRTTSLAIFPMQAEETEIRAAIARHYDPTYAAIQEEEQRYQQRLEKMAVVSDSTDETTDDDAMDRLFRIILLDALRHHASLITWRIRFDGSLRFLYRIEGQDTEMGQPPNTLRDKLLQRVCERASLPGDSEDPVLQGSITLSDEEGALPPLAIIVDQTDIVQRPPLEPVEEELIKRASVRIKWEQTFDSLAQKLLCIILEEAFTCSAHHILLEQGKDYMYVYHMTDEKKRLVMQPAGAMFLPVLQEIRNRATPRKKVGFWKRLFGLQSKLPADESLSGAFRFDVEEESFKISFEVSSFRGRQFVRLTVHDLEDVYMWGMIEEIQTDTA